MKRPENYNTKQREAIIDYIVSLNGEHVTAGQIMQHFAGQGFSIGLTTIYRHLDRLVESGTLRRYTLDGTSGACYQYDAEEENPDYFHLKCEECGALLHLKCGTLDGIRQHVFQDHAFEINAMKTVFYGKCAGCLEGGRAMRGERV